MRKKRWTALIISALFVLTPVFYRSVSAQEINLILHQPTETVTESQLQSSSETSQSSPDTGENSGIAVPCVCALCAAAAGTALIIKGKKD